MRASFPIFLNKSPTYLGFTPQDLVLLAIGLFLGMLFRTSTLVSAFIGLGIISLRRLLDSRGVFVLNKGEKTLDFSDDLKRINL